jgi:hypothetical protein
MRAPTWLLWCSVALGCSAVPQAGDPCSSIEDTICASENEPTIYACLTEVYEELDCREICAGDDLLFTSCGPSEELGHHACRCAGPCDGNPRVFDGVLGSPCNADEPAPICAIAGNVLMSVTCDLALCAWRGTACTAGFACRPGCMDGICVEDCSTPDRGEL